MKIPSIVGLWPPMDHPNFPVCKHDTNVLSGGLDVFVTIWQEVLHRLLVISMPQYKLRFETQFVRCGGRSGRGVQSGINRNDDSTFISDCYTHHRPILHRVVTVYNTADRRTIEGQTYKALRIGRRHRGPNQSMKQMPNCTR